MKHYGPVKNNVRQQGFALLIVLLALVLAATIGVSYVTGSAVCLSGSSNLLAAGRAKYLAESGVEHAIYMLRKDPAAVPAARAEALNSQYYPDSSQDGYIFWAEHIGTQSQPGLYMITAEGHCGDIEQRVSATVCRAAAAEVNIGHGMMIAREMAVLPWKLNMKGDFHINGTLINFARIDGDASAQGGILDMVRRISGSKTPWSQAEEIPGIQWDQYENYSLYMNSYSAEEINGNELAADHPVAEGRAVTGNNPGGVVLVRPAGGGQTVRIKNEFNFTGTIVIDGDVVLDGRNIDLKAVEGFPTIVASGKIYVNNDAQANIKGFVVAGGGIVPMGDTSNAQTDIKGGLISDRVGYDYYLKGNHNLQYDPQLSRLYDYTDSGNLALAEMVTWHD